MLNLAETSSVVLRIGIGIIFINSALGKFANPAGAIQLSTQLGFIPDPVAFIMFLRVAELIGGIVLVIGFHIKYVSFLVAIFMCTTLLTIAVPSVKIVGGYPLITAGGVIKDLAILGGALSLIAKAPDRFTVDNKFFRPKKL